MIQIYHISRMDPWTSQGRRHGFIARRDNRLEARRVGILFENTFPIVRV